jgi:hypothetical protein
MPQGLQYDSGIVRRMINLGGGCLGIVEGTKETPGVGVQLLKDSYVLDKVELVGGGSIPQRSSRRALSETKSNSAAAEGQK